MVCESYNESAEIARRINYINRYFHSHFDSICHNVVFTLQKQRNDLEYLIFDDFGVVYNSMDERNL